MNAQVAHAICDLYADAGKGQAAGDMFMGSKNIVWGGSQSPANTRTHFARTYDGVSQIL